MRLVIPTFALACAALAPNSHAQNRPFNDTKPRDAFKDRYGNAGPDTPAAPIQAPEGAQLGRDAGVGVDRPLVFDDSIPLPVAAQLRATPTGDEIVEPASGDPFFLGFQAGSYYPPAGERIDPQLIDSVQLEPLDGRLAPTVFAFVMFQKRMTPARVAELEALGVRVLEFHPHYSLKVALRPELIDQVAALDYVRWVGQPRTWQKLSPILAQRVGSLPANVPMEVIVNVFESDLNAASTEERIGGASMLDGGVEVAVDSNLQTNMLKRVRSRGWQERALESSGLEIVEYFDSTRAFRCRALPAAVVPLTGLDFVQFVEPFDAPKLMHDESTPMINSDITRWYNNGGTNLAAIAGQLDSGIDQTHADFNFWGWGWHYGATGAWTDGCEHGSHVAGTVLGRGNVNPQFKGNAPGLGSTTCTRYYNEKIFGDNCLFTGTSLAGMAIVMQNPIWDGSCSTPIPHVVNNSWGTSPSPGFPFKGTEQDARDLDNLVYNSGQMWLFSAGNDGTTGVGLQPGAKNAFTFGSVDDAAFVFDPGEVSNFSSRGPMGDGRWKPNVAAPGCIISSVDANSGNGYKGDCGTSMAAPHGTGVVAQLVDSYSFLRYWPERTQSLLMASAITKNNVVLTSPGESHHNKYGTGRIDAYKAMWNTSQLGWLNWGGYRDPNGWTYGDFTINPGCTRVVVCLNYSDVGASSGASKALVSNFDLYLDQDPIDPNGNTGDWFVQQSSVDNTEIRIIDSPQVGNWRWKLFPTSATNGVYWGITMYVFYGDTTPDCSLSLTKNKAFARPNEDVQFTASVFAPSAMASAVFLDATTDWPYTYIAAEHYLGDGVLADSVGNYHGGEMVEIGNILHGTSRALTWTLRYLSEGNKTFSARAVGDNFTWPSGVEHVVIDGTAPSTVTGLVSTTHTPFAWSNNPNLGLSWNASSDNLSGVAGYSYALAQPQPVIPDAFVDTGSTNAAMGPLASSAQDYYFSVLAVDNASNTSSTIAAQGPFRIDTVAPSSVSNAQSPTHAVGAVSCNQNITVQWQAASDGLSGIWGYATLWNHSAGTVPPATVNTQATFVSTNLAKSPQAYYFHVRAVDNAGNGGPTTHVGPFFINPNPGTIYCTAKVNSLGCTPQIAVSGTPKASQTSGFVISASNVRNQKPGLLFYGINGSHTVPFQGGTHCVNTPTKRSLGLDSGGTPSGNNCTGVYTIDFSSLAHGLLGGNPPPQVTQPGTTVNAQFWGRDPGFPAPNNTTLSNAVEFVLCQ